MFYLRAQRLGESVIAFARASYELAGGCYFINKNEQIKDQFIIGFQNKWLSERLPLNPNLKLDKVLEMAKSYE